MLSPEIKNPAGGRRSGAGGLYLNARGHRKLIAAGVSPLCRSAALLPQSEDHPARGSRDRYWFADGTLVMRMFAPSYSILRPALSATTPSSITSVSFAAYSNGHDASVLPLAASTQFISWFSSGIRGSFAAGLPYDAC